MGSRSISHTPALYTLSPLAVRSEGAQGREAPGTVGSSSSGSTRPGLRLWKARVEGQQGHETASYGKARGGPHGGGGQAM